MSFVPSRITSFFIDLKPFFHTIKTNKWMDGERYGIESFDVKNTPKDHGALLYLEKEFYDTYT